ncbi:hypothetical protein K432DRAFT_381489 [Lepidopterella palustris CBS 459.81]|uniref:Uncharacterized protein n=1 Tax=Lepidopterella palustris CBS 459.81 TaxID=1314670 RepID=A0A8E2ECW3_9PEZI|nr:hypothetical protein K432DRAFT_381489 [Lepidopterella palustris CBS 459.81]
MADLVEISNRPKLALHITVLTVGCGRLNHKYVVKRLRDHADFNRVYDAIAALRSTNIPVTPRLETGLMKRVYAWNEGFRSSLSDESTIPPSHKPLHDKPRSPTNSLCHTKLFTELDGTEDKIGDVGSLFKALGEIASPYHSLISQQMKAMLAYFATP